MSNHHRFTIIKDAPADKVPAGVKAEAEDAVEVEAVEPMVSVAPPAVTEAPRTIRMFRCIRGNQQLEYTTISPDMVDEHLRSGWMRLMF